MGKSNPLLDLLISSGFIRRIRRGCFKGLVSEGFSADLEQGLVEWPGLNRH
jgi:hypothetical protein